MAYRDDFRKVRREAVWSMSQIAAIALLVMVLLYGLGFLATGGNLVIYRFWAPKMENVKRQVFENTQGYVQGKIDYLSRLRFQYQVAEGPQRAALRTMILGEASTVDSTRLPDDLRAFIGDLKAGQS